MFKSLVVAMSLLTMSASFASEIEFTLLDLNPGTVKDAGNLEIHAKYDIRYEPNDGKHSGTLGDQELAVYDIEENSGHQTVAVKTKTIKLDEHLAKAKKYKTTSDKIFVVVTITEFNDIGFTTASRKLAQKYVTLKELTEKGSITFELKGKKSSEFRAVVTLK
jgi:hypothetical protein